MAKSSKKKHRALANDAPTGAGKTSAEVPVEPGKRAKPRLKAARRKSVSRGPQGRSEAVAELTGDIDRLARLLAAIGDLRTGKRKSPRTQKLLASGVAKMAQKLIEEAAETAIDAVRGDRTGLISESADLLFNLVVLWSALEVTPGDVWAEMDRREQLLGMAEKLPKPGDAGGA